MNSFKQDSSPSDIMPGELRRFDLLTKDEKEIEELKEVISEKGLSRNDLAIILFCLRVKPRFSRSDFGI